MNGPLNEALNTRVLALQMYVVSRAETNTANTRVFIKDFGTWIVKLVLEYTLRSHDQAHICFCHQ